jgi:hypothetical protein
MLTHSVRKIPTYRTALSVASLLVLTAACASTSEQDSEPGTDEGELRADCVFGSTFASNAPRLGATTASPLSAFTAGSALNAVQKKRLIDTVRAVAPATTTVAQAFTVAGGRFERTSLDDGAGRRTFTAYTFRQGAAVHGAIFEQGLGDVVARVGAGAVQACTATKKTCIFPGDYSADTMSRAGFRRVDERVIDQRSIIDNEDSVEASQIVRAVIETAIILSPPGATFSSARDAARRMGDFSVTTYEQGSKRYLAVEQDGEVYGAIFEAPRASQITVRAVFEDTAVSRCSAFLDASPRRALGQSCIHGGQSPVCGQPTMVCAAGLECDTRGADHVCASGTCRAAAPPAPAAGRPEGASCIHLGRSPTCGQPAMACAAGLECDTNGADHVCASGTCTRP